MVSIVGLVMDKCSQAYLGFNWDEKFTREHGVEFVNINYFIIIENKE
jgi:hypothetical protein